jgi:pimeloyl-ACP methyl ester carboxylesterase
MMQDDHYDRLHAIPIATCVLSGELDRTCPPSHSRRIGAALRNAQNRWLPRIGHMLAYEAPEAVIDAVHGA